MLDTNTEKNTEFTLPITLQPERLDKVLAKLLPEHSRSRLQGWIEAGHVYVNAVAVTRQRHVVLPGDNITVYEQASPEELAFEPEAINFPVVADTPQWIVVDKPAGLVTHPGAGNWSGTLLNGLLHRYPELKNVARAGIVHRLDKLTSGLMVVARTPEAQTHLVRQLQERSVKRHYAALVHGFTPSQASIELPIGRDPHVPVRMATNGSAARAALTHYQTLRHGLDCEGRAYSELACQLHTGRTHQIRVHLASQQHPLVGDELYSGKLVLGAERQMLHARALAFIDPATNEWVEFESPLSADITAVQESIEWKTQLLTSAG